jgi:predicted GIY-YIG superfamily endonuclease
MAFHIYILRCADGSYYTGHTENLKARVAGHGLGRIPGDTQTRRPLTLVFSETFPSRNEALGAERRIKG